MLFAGNFAPRGWAFCDGQLLAISQYTALFSILGTTYGGDGRTTFGLPDLRGRVPIGPGTGPGLSNRPLGARGGAEQVTLSVTQLASHAHITQKSSDEPAGAGTGNYPLQRVLDDDLVVPGATTDTTGGGQPHENMPPFLAVYYCIALQGIFPSRN
ncbi:MAG: phage tail protein [Rhodothermaceae bacterium]|nr:phage tail protein [Rhodothermaceae bacterium]